MISLGMNARRPRGRLLIGKTALLRSTTPKALRHYEKLRSLSKLGSDSDHRLCAVERLLRLHQIKRSQTLDLSLSRIRAIFEEGGVGTELKDVLKTLFAESEKQVDDLKRKGDRLWAMLAKNVPSVLSEEPYILELSRHPLREQWNGINPEALEQEKELPTTLDALRWPNGYRRPRDAFVPYLTNRSEECMELLALDERFTALETVLEDSPNVELLVGDLIADFEGNSLSEGLYEGSRWEASMSGTALSKVLTDSVLLVQKRCAGSLRRLFSGGSLP